MSVLHLSDSETTTTSTKVEREEGMGGLAKGLAIIESFSAAQPRLSVSEAAASSGTTPAAARRCLRTLEELGYVSYDGKYYRPTPRMMRLPNAYSEADQLPVLAKPRLAALRDAFDESASLAVLDGDHAFFVARSESSHMASTGMRVGSRVAAPASAAGRALLAAMPDEELDRVLRRHHMQRSTAKTLVTIEAIRNRIREARELGYSYTDEELELGVRAVAVPVVDVTGRTQAALTISALAARVSMDEMRDRFVPVVQGEAAKLGAML